MSHVDVRAYICPERVTVSKSVSKQGHGGSRHFRFGVWSREASDAFSKRGDLCGDD